MKPKYLLNSNTIKEDRNNRLFVFFGRKLNTTTDIFISDEWGTGVGNPGQSLLLTVKYIIRIILQSKGFQ